MRSKRDPNGRPGIAPFVTRWRDALNGLKGNIRAYGIPAITGPLCPVPISGLEMAQKWPQIRGPNRVKSGVRPPDC